MSLDAALATIGLRPPERHEGEATVNELARLAGVPRRKIEVELIRRFERGEVTRRAFIQNGNRVWLYRAAPNS